MDEGGLLQGRPAAVDVFDAPFESRYVILDRSEQHIEPTGVLGVSRARVMARAIRV